MVGTPKGRLFRADIVRMRSRKNLFEDGRAFSIENALQRKKSRDKRLQVPISLLTISTITVSKS